jgi:PPK2 family polyphosphate:nucleotide phosphotransferase
MFNSSSCRITDGKNFRLRNHSTELQDALDKKELKAHLVKERERISELQEVLFAEQCRSLLLVFQAMDAAGKDSAIGHLLSGVNPQGCCITSFKQPSSEELTHDFLWRHAKAAPARGMIGVHNRSHYEEVLVVKVHPEYLMGQRIAQIRSPKDANAAFWKRRYRSIRDWEEHLTTEGVVIMKFFLHMSKKEQKKRFLERIDEPLKNWKFSAGDVRERALFDQYMDAYEEAIAATAAEHAPWFVIPADDQWESRAIIAQLVRERLEAMDLRMPVLNEKQKTELAEAKKMLTAEP